MTRVRVACTLFGVAFGFLISWATMTDPATIHAMLQLEDSYLFLMMGSSVAVGFVGVRLARRHLQRAVLTREPISWSIQKPEARHVWGSALFGLGWAITESCPGPITAQLGQGETWALATGAGVVLGVSLALRRARLAATAPAAQAVSPTRSTPARPASPLGGLVPQSAPE
ncbi:DUF6691 family protein [Conexibacter sp. SYSU D00693]|uniref:DUF6691 family protein n=1 Tax=Conexibacter sp. SYSU D00693 TaxID=2812560 RepID=UPI00196A8D86|nr:DUF6691 family protein [Conexibacter sp. SYSU D00693]